MLLLFVVVVTARTATLLKGTLTLPYRLSQFCCCCLLLLLNINCRLAEGDTYSSLPTFSVLLLLFAVVVTALTATLLKGTLTLPYRASQHCCCCLLLLFDVVVCCCCCYRTNCHLADRDTYSSLPTFLVLLLLFVVVVCCCLLLLPHQLPPC